MAYGTRSFNTALTRALQIINRVPRHCVIFLNKDGFYSVRLLASRQTPKLEDHSGWLSTTAYSIRVYSQLTFISGSLLPNPQSEKTRHLMVSGTHGWNLTNYRTHVLKMLLGYLLLPYDFFLNSHYFVDDKHFSVHALHAIIFTHKLWTLVRNSIL